MNYVLKQKLLSLGNNFTIKDVEGHDAYQVKGQVVSIGDKLSFQDLEGNELIYIENSFSTATTFGATANYSPRSGAISSSSFGGASRSRCRAPTIWKRSETS